MGCMSDNNDYNLLNESLKTLSTPRLTQSHQGILLNGVTLSSERNAPRWPIHARRRKCFTKTQMQEGGRTRRESGNGPQAECSTALGKLKIVKGSPSTEIIERHPQKQMLVPSQSKSHPPRGLRAGEEENAQVAWDARGSGWVGESYEEWAGFGTQRTVSARIPKPQAPVPKFLNSVWSWDS